MNTWAALRQTLTKYDHEKVDRAMAIRNSVAVVLPLAIAGFYGQTALGLVGSLGALNVAYSDANDPRPMRVRRMLVSTIISSTALAVGGLSASNNVLAILIAGLWALAAGMLVALGQTAADIGTISLVTVVVFGSRSMTPRQAMLSGLVAMGGGLLQTLFSIVFGPGRNLLPERQALASLYLQLSRLASAPAASGTAPLATAEFTKARLILGGSPGADSPERERLRSLLNQAERMRLRLFTLGRLRRRLERDESGPEAMRLIESFVNSCAQVIERVGDSLRSGVLSDDTSLFLREAERAADELRSREWPDASKFFAALVRDTIYEMDSLAGQVRSVARMAERSDLMPVVQPTAPEHATADWLRRARNQMEVLRANLTLQSVACRHAVRIAACVALGDAIGRSFDWQRTYWIPMTIAIVLKPDFLTTFSRGALRLAGTLFGLILATALYHLLPASLPTDVLLVGAFTLMLRWVGPANYGIFTIAVSALVVALIAGTGVAPRQVILLRGLNTAIGGALALAAYAAWPTWERTQTGEMTARLLDAYRDYLRAIRSAPPLGETAAAEQLTVLRQAARVARSNVEASAARLGGEPGTNSELPQLAGAMLASSHNFIYAAMTLEGIAVERHAADEIRALGPFLDMVEITLHSLSATLRGSRVDARDLPDLRAAHRRLLATLPDEYSLAAVETDRMANALNTLKEQVFLMVKVRLRSKSAESLIDSSG